MSSLSPEVDELAAAVQKFASQITEEDVLVSQAVVLWEAVSFDGDGTPQRQIKYCIPTDNFSLTGALGLLDGGRHYIRRDIFGKGDE